MKPQVILKTASDMTQNGLFAPDSNYKSQTDTIFGIITGAVHCSVHTEVNKSQSNLSLSVSHHVFIIPTTSPLPVS